MKRPVLFFLVIVAAAILCATPAAAQKTNLIGIIDTQAFLRDSKVVQEQRQSFLQVLEGKQQQLRAKQEEIRKLEQELRREGSQRSPEERRAVSDELSREAKEFQRLREDLAEETRKRDEEVTRKILAELNRVVQEYREKNNYSIILERRMVAAFDDALDVTADIVKAYDRANR